MKTIVLGFDGTEASQRALERAAAIGAAFGSTVVVTSVSTRMGGAVHGGGSGDPTDPPDAHESLLDGATKELTDRGVTAESVLAMGDAAEAIVELARAAQCRPHRGRDARARFLRARSGTQRQRLRPTPCALRRPDRPLAASDTGNRRARCTVATALLRRQRLTLLQLPATSSSAPVSTGSRRPTTSPRSFERAALTPEPTSSSSTRRGPARARPGSRAASSATTTSSRR